MNLHHLVADKLDTKQEKVDRGQSTPARIFINYLHRTPQPLHKTGDLSVRRRIFCLSRRHRRMGLGLGIPQKWECLVRVRVLGLGVLGFGFGFGFEGSNPGTLGG